MRVGQVFRYVDKRNADPAVETIDGLSNFYRATGSAHGPTVLLERGINPIGRVRSGDGTRTPAVLIRSSPHKRGREETPWADIFDTDVGHIRYFGDNKPRRQPSNSEWTVSTAWDATGNRALVNLFEQHRSPDQTVRRRAAPLLFFEAASVPGRVKGQIQFHGFGLIDAVEVITQYHPDSGLYFSNLVFDFVVLRLDDEGVGLDWSWIDARRDPNLLDSATLADAPASWKRWVERGSDAVPHLRRSVARLAVRDRQHQMPEAGSKDESILRGIYAFYSTARDPDEPTAERTTSMGRSMSQAKARFEMLAAYVTERVLRGSGADYTSLWVTRGTGDEGVDFVGRLRVGLGFSATDLVVLGQAKCELMTSPTNGVHIARTVARLQRGWIGVYVTTSYFSAQVQQEVIEDQYPIVLIPGSRIADVIRTELHDRGIDLAALLREIDDRYESSLSYKRPAEALHA